MRENKIDFMKKKLVLAYSGGLDTSFCTHYLSNEEGYEVHTVMVNTGGFTGEEIKDLEAKALKFGASKHLSIDATDDYYNHCIRFLIFGNVMRNRNYPISVSSERSFQALKVINYARSMGINTIAHGSTGAGNDQVRFDAIFQVMAPEIEVIAPIRDLRLSREQEIDYLVKAGLEFNFEKSKYSINQGLWGTSVGGKETLTSAKELPDAAFPVKELKQGSEVLEIDFDKGEPVKINGNSFSDPVKLIQYLESIASVYGIGRDVHVGETIIGIKGRVGFQASAAYILINSHYALEKHVLSKWQQHWKEQLGNWYGMFIHEGLFLEPVMRDIENFLISSQRNVSGKVFVRLRPYSLNITGVESPKDLMNSGVAKYGEEIGAWTGDDVKGFTKIFSNPMKIYYTVNEQEKPEF
jgi:argininosuccinate synthase